VPACRQSMQLPVSTQQPSKPPTFEGWRGPNATTAQSALDRAACSATRACSGTRCAGTSRDRTKCAARPRVNSGHAQPSAPKRATETTRSRQGDRTEEHPQSTGRAYATSATRRANPNGRFQASDRKREDLQSTPSGPTRRKMRCPKASLNDPGVRERQRARPG
jgi:hypothetical protein